MLPEAGGTLDDALLAEVRQLLADEVARGDSSPVEPVTPLRVAAALRSRDAVVGAGALLALAHRLSGELAGAGPLEPLLADPAVTDVCVHAGPSGPEAWVDRGSGMVRVELPGLADERSVRALAVRLATTAGERLDDASPCVDGRLPGGGRLHAVLPPLATGGTALSLRLPRAASLPLGELARRGGATPAAERLLRGLVRSRAALLVTGGTGAGKTTLLSALLGEADPRDRVVLVEDVGELQPPLPHVVRLEARRPNVDGAGGVGLEVLVRQALRMRPDRLVVGECRGAEVRELLAALNTGHAGGAGTMHANTPADVPARLEALGALAGMDARAVAAQASSGLDAVVHLVRRGDARVVAEVAVVLRDATGLRVRTGYATGSGASEAWPELARLCGWRGDPPTS